MTNTNTRVIDLMVGELELLFWKIIRESLPQSQTHLPTYNEKPFLNIDEASSLTGIPKQTIYRMTSKGEIPHIKGKGRALKFEPEKLLVWMREGRNETITEAENKLNKKILGRKNKRIG